MLLFSPKSKVSVSYPTRFKNIWRNPSIASLGFIIRYDSDFCRYYIIMLILERSGNG